MYVFMMCIYIPMYVCIKRLMDGCLMCFLGFPPYLKYDVPQISVGILGGKLSA